MFVVCAPHGIPFCLNLEHDSTRSRTEIFLVTADVDTETNIPFGLVRYISALKVAQHFSINHIHSVCRLLQQITNTP